MVLTHINLGADIVFDTDSWTSKVNAATYQTN